MNSHLSEQTNELPNVLCPQTVLTSPLLQLFLGSSLLECGSGSFSTTGSVAKSQVGPCS